MYIIRAMIFASSQGAERRIHAQRSRERERRQQEHRVDEVWQRLRRTADSGQNLTVTNGRSGAV
jgi:hypothetical protein